MRWGERDRGNEEGGRRTVGVLYERRRMWRVLVCLLSFIAVCPLTVYIGQRTTRSTTGKSDLRPHPLLAAYKPHNRANVDIIKLFFLETFYRGTI